jgi:REP element-mobilizing transposase RayT
MVLNDPGKMVEKWWIELPHKFPDITLDTYVIMPNHFHGIIVNTGNGGNGGIAGADLRVCPCPDVHPDEKQRAYPDETGKYTGEHTGKYTGEHTGKYRGEHTGSPLHAVIQWFKTMTTNEYMRGVKTLGWIPFNKKLWQRNYYERIIRNGQSYQNISAYIINNPANWGKDRFRRKTGHSKF